MLLWAYLFRQLISFLLGHPHQLLSKGVDLPLGGAFLWIDRSLVIESPFFEVNEICGGPSSPGGAVSRVVSYLSAFEACIVSGAVCSLGDVVLHVPPLSSPLVWGSGATKVHGNRSVVKCRGSGGRINRGSPVSDGVLV